MSKDNKEIKKAVVVGSGVMGSGIAAQLANAGIEVTLLDIVPRDLEKGEDRSKIAKGAIEKMLKTKPAPLMHKKNVKNISAGNLEDDLDKLGEADLIIEAIIENPKIKSDLYKTVDKHRKKGSIIGSNTSTIPLKELSDGQSEQFKKDFVITHFFNPPRYMPLLEVVTSNDNDPKAVKALEDFMDRKMGKTVIHCKDTPGFIANRVGTYWLTAAMTEAIDLGLTVEQADAVGGRPMGIPKTGVFGLVDLVGLDLMPHISESLNKNVPEGDDYRNIYRDLPLVNKMIEEGYTGRKGKGGFYSIRKDGHEKIKQVIDISKDEISYSDAKRPKMQSSKRAKKGGLRELVSHKDKESQYAWNVLKKTLTYAASMIPQINDDLIAIDDAMKLGYNWKYGPFEMIDKMGVDFFINKLEAENYPVPEFLEKARGKSFYQTVNGQLQYLGVDGNYKTVERPEGVLLLSDIKRGSKPVAKNPCAKVWDIGDGVLCLEFTSPQNSLDPLVLYMMNKARKMIDKSNGKYKALVIHNERQNFSVGANIMLAEKAAQFGQHWAIDKLVDYGQSTYKKLKYADFPVVTAPAGMALGGGCEISLHADAVVAHAETYTGLVEMGVGFIPGWGGCVEMLRRGFNDKRGAKGPMPPVVNAFETIAMVKVSTSGEEAKSLKYFSKDDEIVMNKKRVLAQAKAKALELVDGYKAPEPQSWKLPGAAGRAALQMAVNDMYAKGVLSTYAVALADQLAFVLTGGDKADGVTEIHEDDVRKLEGEAFKRLVRDPRTLLRIQHMLKFNKALDMNKEFLSIDGEAREHVKPAEIRQTLKGSIDLKGRKNKPANDVQEKLSPSFDAAKAIIKGKKPKKKKTGSKPRP